MIRSREFQRRLLFRGQLELTTGLHIGGGRVTLSPSDSPVVRSPDGRPYIPGSSFKGAFRSTVEKLATAAPGIRSCGLQGGEGCVGAPGEEQERFNQSRRGGDGGKAWNELKLVQELDGKLCDTCLLFGSPFLAAKLLCHDLYPPEKAEMVVQIRDGVAIDRDSERAVDRLKYDYEVVPASQRFELTLTLDDPDPTDLGLVSIGLTEYLAGFGQIGGKRSRGLGKCRLVELSILELDLTGDDSAERARRLKRYLLGKTPEDKMVPLLNPSSFLEQQIEALLAGPATPLEGGRRAQADRE